MTRFLLDVMLGKLAVYLRMCGHDAAYALDRGVEADDRILDIAREEDRTVLTRDAAMSARAEAAILLDAADVRDQLRELQRAGVDLELTDEPKRCGRCNGDLDPVGDADLPESVPTDHDVYRCGRCGQYFWRGSHWDDVAATLSEL